MTASVKPILPLLAPALMFLSFGLSSYSTLAQQVSAPSLFPGASQLPSASTSTTQLQDNGDMSTAVPGFSAGAVLGSNSPDIPSHVAIRSHPPSPDPLCFQTGVGWREQKLAISPTAAYSATLRTGSVRTETRSVNRSATVQGNLHNTDDTCSSGQPVQSDLRDAEGRVLNSKLRLSSELGRTYRKPSTPRPTEHTYDSGIFTRGYTSSHVGRPVSTPALSRRTISRQRLFSDNASGRRPSKRTGIRDRNRAEIRPDFQ